MIVFVSYLLNLCYYSFDVFVENFYLISLYVVRFRLKMDELDNEKKIENNKISKKKR